MARKKNRENLWAPSRGAAPARVAGDPGGNPAIHAIWDVVAAIPRGEVWSYGAVARAAGLPGRARQAGFALRIAPQAMNLPWHRVIGAGGRIVFPSASAEYREQVKRLRADGITVRDGRVPTGQLQSGAQF